MHVFHTAGVPPSSGSNIFANIGSRTNSSADARKMVKAKSAVRTVMCLVSLSPVRRGEGGAGDCDLRSFSNSQGRFRRCRTFKSVRPILRDALTQSEEDLL